jgi:hypothetical protein
VVPFAELEVPLADLLRRYGRATTKPNSDLPYWYLQNDGVWEIQGAEGLRREQDGSKPLRTELRKTTGGFPEELDVLVRQDHRLAGEVTRLLLDRFVDPLQHEALTAELGLGPVPARNLPEVEAERALRLDRWAQLLSEGAELVAPSRLQELGVFRGGRGIWFDKERTGSIVPEGIAVAVLHTGESYADELSDDGLIYHYPTTESRGRDDSEVAAMKAAMRPRVPTFTVTHSGPGHQKRAVRLSWVEDFDDAARCFTMSFGDEPSGAVQLELEDAPFFLTADAPTKQALRNVRQRKQDFPLKVFRQYGTSQTAQAMLTFQNSLKRLTFARRPRLVVTIGATGCLCVSFITGHSIEASGRLIPNRRSSGPGRKARHSKRCAFIVRH